MKNLTQKQQQVFNFIHRYFTNHGMAPSVREVAQALGKSAQAIQQHIEILRLKGYLDHQPSKSRANIPKSKTIEDEKFIELPILGRIQAGLPVLAEENQEGTMFLPREWVRGSNAFLLRVAGESMIGAHILPADLVLIRSQTKAENGEIVVARVNGSEATLKRFHQLKNKVLLKPENSSFDPIEVDQEDCEVVGKVIGVYRRY